MIKALFLWPFSLMALTTQHAPLSRPKTHILITVLIFNGCSGQILSEDKFEISSYRKAIGQSEVNLKQIFGASQVKRKKFPLHDPDTYEDGLGINVGKETVFFGMKHGKVYKVVFQSPQFKLNNNIFVGQNYCDILSTYPELDFRFDYVRGGILTLTDRERSTILEFSTVYLPIGKYVREGKPDKGDMSLCGEILSRIILTPDLDGLFR